MVNLLPDNEVSNSSSVSSSKDNHIDVSESSNSRDHEDAPQIITDDLQRLKLDKKSKDNRSKKANRNVQYKPEKWMLSDQEEGISSQLNLAVVSHLLVMHNVFHLLCASDCPCQFFMH